MAYPWLDCFLCYGMVWFHCLAGWFQDWDYPTDEAMLGQ